jgi:hypothetical protein
MRPEVGCWGERLEMQESALQCAWGKVAVGAGVNYMDHTIVKFGILLKKVYSKPPEIASSVSESCPGLVGVLLHDLCIKRRKHKMANI